MMSRLNRWIDNAYEPVVVTGAICILIGFAWLMWSGFRAYQEEKAHARVLMAQCLADGRKEYECRAMIYNHSTITIVPVNF